MKALHVLGKSHAFKALSSLEERVG